MALVAAVEVLALAGPVASPLAVRAVAAIVAAGVAAPAGPMSVPGGGCLCLLVVGVAA